MSRIVSLDPWFTSIGCQMNDPFRPIGPRPHEFLDLDTGEEPGAPPWLEALVSPAAIQRYPGTQRGQEPDDEPAPGSQHSPDFGKARHRVGRPLEGGHDHRPVDRRRRERESFAHASTPLDAQTGCVPSARGAHRDRRFDRDDLVLPRDRGEVSRAGTDNYTESDVVHRPFQNPPLEVVDERPQGSREPALVTVGLGERVADHPGSTRSSSHTTPDTPGAYDTAPITVLFSASV